MQLRLLGPVEILDRTGRVVPVGGPKERAVLALLGIHANEVVSDDRIAHALWADNPPRTAAKTIQSYISRLRRALANAGATPDELAIETRAPGYLLRVRNGGRDVDEAEELVAQATTAVERGDHAWAAVTLTRAWRLWRGASLAEFADQPFASATAIRLEELRQHALEARIDAELATGRHAALIGELEGLCGDHPLRERLWSQRMLALYRSGRQAEALRVYQDLRRHLADELGIDPDPAVTALEQAIVQQAPSLDWLQGPTVAPTDSMALPTGVVTFLLTDIVESSALWEAHGRVMPSVLEEHDRLVVDTVTGSGGHTIKSKGEGDSTLSVFARATDAMAAAISVQAAIDRVGWPDDITLRVRVAMHTGEANERDGDYYGTTVNRAARLRSLADGGAIVLSAVTADLVRDHLPPGWQLVDQGRRELAGHHRAEDVVSLVRSDDVAAMRAAAPDHTGPLSLPLPAGLEPTGPIAFVGRTAELDRLSSVLDEAFTGVRQAVVIAGEPGIGKTRLASEVAALAHEQGAVVLFGRCDEDLGVPYQPFAEALTHFVTHRPPGSDQLLGNLPSELGRLLPQLAQLVPDLPPPLSADAETERQWLFDAVAAWLSATCARSPVVLVLDDVHWATKATLALLRHVLRSTTHLPLLLIATYRDTELGRTHPLADALADLRREARLERVLLHGLDTDGATSFVESAARRSLDDAERQMAEAMRIETNGNPFFMGEVIRHMVDTGAVARSADRWVLTVGSVEDAGLPEGVREVISRRVSRLSDAANTALATASVVGPTFERRLLEQIPDAASDPETLLDALDEAVRAGLVLEHGRGYRFAHALIRQTLYQELTSARRTRLHRRVAEAIEQLGDGDAPIEALAHHFAEAAVDGQEAKAVDYCRRAGEQAMARLAYEEAADLFDRAVQSADLDPSILTEEERAELLVARCEALLAGGEVGPAGSAVEELQRSAKGSTRLAAWASCFAGQLAVLVHPERLDTIEREVATAAEQLAALDDAAGEALAHTVRAACLARLGRIADCETALDRALTAARRGGEHRRVNAVLAGEPLAALWGPNPVPRAGGRCLDVIRLLRITTGSPVVEATSMRCQAVLEALRGRADAGRAMIGRARRTLGDLGLRHAGHQVDLFAGMVELLADDPAAAEPELRRAYEGFRAMGVDVDAAQAAAFLARACLALGRDDDAATLCDESEQLGGHDLQASIAWRSVRALLAARAGDHETARGLADAAVAIAERTDALLDHGDACLALATVLAAVGDDTGAHAAARRAAALYERKGASTLVARARALVPTERPTPLDSGAFDGERHLAPLNDAARTWDRVMSAFISGTPVAELPIAPNIHFEDRRRAMGTAFDTAGAWRDSVEAIAGLGGAREFRSVRVLATRGPRLLLVSATFATDDFELGGLLVLGIGQQDDPDLWITFDAGAEDEAFAELDARYLAGDGAAHARALELLVSVAEAYNERDDLHTSIHDNVVMVDHRSAPARTAEGRSGMLDLLWDELANIPDLVVRGTAVHRITPDGGVVSIVVQGHAPSGQEVEELGHAVVVIEDDRVVRIDGHRDLAAALRQWDDAHPTTRRLEGRVVDIAGRVIADWNADHDVAGSVLPSLSDAFRWEDRRRGVQLTIDGQEDYLTNVDQLVRVGGAIVGFEPVAVRGDHLLLADGSLTSTEEDSWGVDAVMLFEADDDDKIVYISTYDPEDRALAEAELEERWEAREARRSPVARQLEELLGRWAGASDPLPIFFEYMSEDFHWEDRRRGAHRTIHGEAESRSELQSIFALGAFSGSLEPLAARGERLLLARYTLRGEGKEAYEAEMLLVAEIDDDLRGNYLASYNLEDRALAEAELEELWAAEQGPSNVASRSFADLADRWNAGEPVEALLAAYHPDFRWEDGRHGAQLTVGGADDRASHMFSIRDIGADHIDLEALAVRGEDLVLFHAVLRNSSPTGFEVHALALVEIDDGLFRSMLTFDADDLDTAMAKLEELAARDSGVPGA
jgi:DNA-binding SARP family transcriptional activator